MHDVAARAPLRPAIHVSPPHGWLNDPNGLVFHDGLWHAYYQHVPDADAPGAMHWGHATSRDLLRWADEPVALAPDRLGVIFSGSIVIDHDGTAGFGAGALVAVFTHHSRDGVERQSLAFSHDDGRTWEKYGSNPVLESDEPDFRDPKVLRHVRDGQPEWVMSLAVGRRIDFYRSADLRQWERSGSYTPDVAAAVILECPDLIRLGPGTGPWLLVFGGIGAGPSGHPGTFGVLGELAGGSFLAEGQPMLLDHGPDFYAAQSFSAAPDGAAIVMGWMSSWRYATTHPSAGRRGVLSLPRRLEHSRADGVLTTVPALDVTARGVDVGARTWSSEPGRAVHVRAEGAIELELEASHGSVATVRIAEGRLAVRRCEDLVVGYAQTYEVPVADGGSHEIVVDHGTLEVFADGGAAVLTALVFPGPRWTVSLDGDGRLTII